MRSFINILLFSALVLSSVLSCIDHRLDGVNSPVRLRLSSTTSGTLVTTYTYDSQNRLNAITKSDGGRATFSYADPQNVVYTQSPGPANPNYTVTITYLQSTTANSVTLSIVNDYGGAFIRLMKTYTLDENRRLTNRNLVDESGTNDLHIVKAYSGANITAGGPYGIFSRANQNTYTAEYDDRLNPFYLFTDPSVSMSNLLTISGDGFPQLLADLRVFSRNNLTALYGNGDTVKYTYEYNAQGLPTKRTQTFGGSDVTTFAYEAY